MTDEFKEEDKVKCLLWCNRHCCLCGKECGTNIEIAHIIPKYEGGSNDIDNAIPLCFDCHSEIGKYNDKHPRGLKYRPEELKSRREKIYEQYTRHLVPPVLIQITQAIPRNGNRILPDVGINIIHQADALPVELLLAVTTFLGRRNLGTPNADLYSGLKPWHLDPRFGINGHFLIPDEVINSKERLEIKIDAVIVDQYKRNHKLLPISWIYMRNQNSWYLEP
jgi:hypothetical protein